MMQMTFKNAVDKTSDLINAYQPGLQALNETDKNRLVFNKSDSRRLTGSVNLDAHLRRKYSNDSRWDYGIGWRMENNMECAIWIEVHDANSNHVKEVIEKVKWLKNWLRNNAVELLNITQHDNGYVWVATKGVSFQRHSKQAHQLANAGLSFPQEKLILK